MKKIGFAEVDESLQRLPELDRLELPNGKRVGEVNNGTLARLLLNCGVSGISHESGRHKNALAYAKHLDGIKEEAGRAAVERWMQEHRA